MAGPTGPDRDKKNLRSLGPIWTRTKFFKKKMPRSVDSWSLLTGGKGDLLNGLKIQEIFIPTNDVWELI